MLGKAYVTVSADVLNIDTVWFALRWVENFADLTLPAGGYDQLRAQLKRTKCKSGPMDMTPDHHFGRSPRSRGRALRCPKLKFATEEESLEIVVPWHKVLSVVRDNYGKFKPGFPAQKTKDVTLPKEGQ